MNIELLNRILNEILEVKDIVQKIKNTETLSLNLNSLKIDSISMDSIMEIVCYYFKVEKLDLISSSKKRNIVYKRYIAMFLCKQFTSNNLTEIGKYFGGLNHSTVINAIHRFKYLMTVSQDLKIHYEKLIEFINNHIDENKNQV